MNITEFMHKDYVRKLIREEVESLFNKSCLPSDSIRIELIKSFFESIKENPNYNLDVPDFEELLDPWDGYDNLTYIQNNLKNNEIIYWEGFIESCWEGVYAKPEYKGLSKEQAIEKIITERFPMIAGKFGMKVVNYDYFDEGDGCIMKIVMKHMDDVVQEGIGSDVFNPHKYNSFDELTEQDLKDIARWGLMGEFDSSGAWDCADWKEENIEKAIDCVVRGFKNILKDKYPEGFGSTPKELILYRMIVLENPKKINKKNVGFSWFSNPNRIDNPDFKQQMLHLRSSNLYLITAKVSLNNVDIPRSLFQRDMVYLENEVVLKNDENIKIVSLDKMDNPRLLHKKIVGEQVENNFNDNFKRWFKNSKVVNADGLPKIMFHGSSSKEKFPEFMGERGIGWFTPDEKYASNYKMDDGRIMQCYLSIRNPYIFKLSPQKEISFEEFIEATNIKAKKLYHSDANEIRPTFDWYNPLYTNFTIKLEELGFDGMKTIEYDKHESWLPFYNDQIKSVENDGTYDDADNIYSEQTA